MDGNSGRLAGGEASAADAASGDWRTEPRHELRQRVVNKIMDNLKRHLPISVPEGLKEPKKIAVQFEEKIYNAATSQDDYLRRSAQELLSMEKMTQHMPMHPSMVNTAIPYQNPTDPVYIGNQGQSSVTPMVNLPAARQQLQPQNFQNNTSSAVQISANLPSALSSVTGLSQSNISNVCQTSNMQNMPDISQNSVSNSVGQGARPGIYPNMQRQMQGRQQQQQIISQQQQSQNQLIYQHQLQRQLPKQKLLHSSLMQPHIQQQSLQPTRLQSSQQSVTQMSSGLQSGQSSIQQTDSITIQSAAQPDIQLNQLSPVQQSVLSLLQQHPQSVARQQAPPSMHQQTPSLQQQPTPVPQQSNLSLQQLQQQLMMQQTDVSNVQQAQLLGQQNHVPDMQQQQQWQQRLPVQQNSLLGMQQPKQMLNQQNSSLHQQQQLGCKSNISGVQQQQQQQQLPGSLPNASNMQVHRRSIHVLQQPKTLAQEQQENQQMSLALLQPQGQQSEHQSTQQQMISQFQSQPAQLQQQLAMQQRPNSLQTQMQQRLQASGALLQSQDEIEPQKQFVQVQRVLPEVSSSTSGDSTAQTGHASVADLQEKIYQKIKSMREMYFADLNELDQQITLELQQHDALILHAKQPEQYEKRKKVKIMLERILMLLQISKNNIHTGLEEKLPLYEKLIVNVLASNKKKIIASQPQGQQQFQHPGGLAHSSQVSQLQQHDNHMNEVQHMNLQVDQGSLLSSQVEAGTPLQSAGSPFVASPFTSLAPSPIPVDSEKHLSGISSPTNAGHIGHQHSVLASPQALAVGVAGIPASSTLEESSSSDGNQANAPSIAPDKMSTSECSLERLIKVVKSSSPMVLRSAISDIQSVVSMIDSIAGSAPSNGSRAAVGEDLAAMTKCRLQARNFMSQDRISMVQKMKRNTSSMPLNNMSSAGSVNDSTKQSYGSDTSELESTATSRVKRQKIEGNHALLEEEIGEINQQLITTIVHTSEENADSVAAASDGEGTVIKCSFTAVALRPSLKAQFASSHMSPILPLRLLVPANYPKHSPVLLDKLPDESSGESDDLSVKAKSRFIISLRGLSQPMSLGEMVRTWDACARKVIAEYAQQTGGGSFSSRYGAWENCVVT